MFKPLAITSTFLLFDILADFVLKKIFRKENEKCESDHDNKQSQSDTIANLKKEIDIMIQESETYNTPSTFAKYSKLQRQITAKQKHLEQQLKEEQLKQPELNQESQNKDKQSSSDSQSSKIQRYRLLMNVFLIGTTMMLIRGEYFEVPGVNYDQIYPISIICAKPLNEFSVQISLASWTILSFNSIRISKKLF